MVTRVQLIRYSGRAEKDLAFRVDHKLCRRSEDLRGSGIRVEKNLEVISLSPPRLWISL